MDQKIYPKGQIAMGNGDLIDVTNVKYDHKSGAKQVHTLRRSGAGITMGNDESSISFDSVVSEDGPEVDFLRLVKKGTVKQIRLKIPGETITVNGVADSRSLELPLDGAIKMSINFIGHTED